VSFIFIITQSVHVILTSCIERSNRAATAYPERGQITVRNPKANDSEPPKDFFFDAVFDDKVEQKHIYDVCASDLVMSVMNGYNGTIFAYGQTGAGQVNKALISYWGWEVRPG